MISREEICVDLIQIIYWNHGLTSYNKLSRILELSQCEFIVI
jgi:hypothetical protein